MIRSNGMAHQQATNTGDSDDDDDHAVKQDYDIDNIFARERVDMDEPMDSMSDDDDIEGVKRNDQVLPNISRPSNRSQLEVTCMIFFYPLYFISPLA